MKIKFSFAMLIFVYIVFANANTDGTECRKKRKLEKMLKRAELLEEEKRKGPDIPRTNEYLDFVDEDEKVKFDPMKATRLHLQCPVVEQSIPESVKSNCKEFNSKEFKNEPSILVAFHNGRLGNQMSSFATLFGFAKLSEGDFRIGLSNDQYLFLSEIFPYFEEHARDHAIEAMYCGNMCQNIKWENHKQDLKKFNYKSVKNIAQNMANSYSNGHGINLGEYINTPLVYNEHLEELRSKVFKFKIEHTKSAQRIINVAKKRFGNEPDALIGIHGRFTDYKSHLTLRGVDFASKKFYIRAIQYYRDKYKNPMFLVTSDDPIKAKNFILDSQKTYKDVFYVGTIETALNGVITKQDSTGIDLALLSKCNHVIVSHGTYGIWAAFLASSKNTHIMAQILPDEKSTKEEQSKEVMEEIIVIKQANLSNFIFMTGD